MTGCGSRADTIKLSALPVWSRRVTESPWEIAWLKSAGRWNVNFLPIFVCYTFEIGGATRYILESAEKAVMCAR